MAKSKEINMNLPSADDLFTTREERDQKNQEHVKNISVYDISDFPNHPFKVKMDDKMVETIESIREHGVLVPALVREKPTGGYEMISGHRRKMASELAGLENIPCIVRNLSDDEAVIVMVDSNLQREEILPSEKAFAYKMRLEAMKRQAGRPSKENVSPVATHLRGQRSDELLGEQVGESKDTIRRYIRLTELIPEILEMVDDKKISMRPAVELSYLPKEEQAILYDTMESEACTPSHAQAIKIRKFSAEGRLNEDVLLSIMSEEKPNQVEQWKIPKNRLKKYFPSGTYTAENGRNHYQSTGIIPETGKKQGTIGILTPREKSIRWWYNEKSALFLFSPPHTLPLWFTSRLPAEKTIRSREHLLFRQVRDFHTLHDSREQTA